MRKESVFLLLILFSILSSASFGQVNNIKKIVLIRHGEKPTSGHNLSCQGFNRAKMLVSVLDKKFGAFDYVFVPALGKGESTGRSRMFETIVPYAVKHNIDVNTKYDEADHEGTANGILKKSGSILLVWEHKNLAGVVKALGIKDQSLVWPNNDFDSIWIITYINGKAVFTKDKENINPPTNCD